MEKIHVKCGFCEHITEIEVKRLYDAYEGLFNCESCGKPLDMINNITDEGID
jgi:transcription elongation factor Elf1